jgi:glycosyltransferase involved in cell wall biosynthesis
MCSKLMGSKLDGPDSHHYVFPGVLAYWRHLARENPDVVIVRGITRWFPRIVSICALLQRRRLVIYDQEDVSPPRWSGTWWRRALLKMVGIPHVTARLELSEEGPQCGSAIPLPFGCPFFPLPLPASRSPSDVTTRILMVAKYRTRKGHANLLKALATSESEYSWRLTLCGEIANQEDISFREMLVKQAAELNIASRVDFQNNVPHGAMLDIYQSHDLVILPSWLEGAAMSPVEAVWAGCAVLVSHDTGTRGYFPAGTAYEFDPHRPADIARALKPLLASTDSLAMAKVACHTHISRVAGNHKILKVFESFIPA